MRLLVITSLFPNQVEPTSALFNKQQLVHLSKLCDLVVVAPVPWYLPIQFSERCSFFSGIPKEELVQGIQVIHPLYLTIPKVGKSFHGFFFFLSIIQDIYTVMKSSSFDAIFATWAYPDGFAAALVAQLLKKPLVLKVHGTDINEFTRYYLRRKMIVYSLRKASKVMAVSQALKRKMVELGIPESHIEVIINGVDTNKFNVMNQISVREELGLPLDKRIILFVGNLRQAKGLGYLLDAISLLASEKNAQFSLFIIGDGEYKQKFLTQVKELDIADSVEFLGVKPHEEIPLWMNACDVFCLPSLNEGIPNVVLEALACGKPVVATEVGGMPEILTDNECGILVEPRSPMKLADALLAAFSRKWDHERIRRQVETLSWESNAKTLYREIVRAAGMHQ